jgi:GT2 family glycosyltransferase
VLYENDEILLKKAIESFLNTRLHVKLFLVDNSPADHLKHLASLDERITYIFNGANLGFGKAHNKVLKQSLVLNPDAYFDPGTLEKLYAFMEENPSVANVMPKVFYPDGKLQYLCKRLPGPTELIVRRFITSDKLIQKINHKYELRAFDYSSTLNTPFLSGCFMFLRVECLKEIGLFDEKIFMYMEDTDLNRRLHAKFKTVFYPEAKLCMCMPKNPTSENASFFTTLSLLFTISISTGGFLINSEEKQTKELKKPSGGNDKIF